jgi:chromosome segregation ATPase
MDIIYRLSGREAKDLNAQLVETQNQLNDRINQLESEQSLVVSCQKRILVLEKAVKYHEENKVEHLQEIKKLKGNLEQERTLKEAALSEVQKANEVVEDAKKTIFDVQQDLASKNADLNNMIDTVSKMEQQIKQLQMPKVPQTKLGQKLNSIKSKK